ncbi:DELLA protein RGL1-like [Forsythia ovata]|uniref:DELLA protein RGL1-like n=1 Tax=Forsythia ovata TaxID=205694 RepID=A0ABD1VF24_9LAMI
MFISSTNPQLEKAQIGLLPPNENKEYVDSSFFPDSLELARNSPRKFKNFKGGSFVSIEASQKISTEKILRLAGERFVQFSSQKFINLNMFVRPYSSSLLSLSSQDKQDVELSRLLLAAAEKVGYKQFDRASRLLSNCQWIASCASTPIQRSVYYFAEALMERIKKETGSSTSGEKGTGDTASLKRDVLAFVALNQELPYTQVVQFTTYRPS